MLKLRCQYVAHRFQAVQVTPCTAHQFSNVLNINFEEVLLLNIFPILWLLETILEGCVWVSVLECVCGCATSRSMAFP